MRIPHGFTRQRYIVCSEKHIYGHTKTWIGRSVVLEKASRLRENKALNPSNLVCP
jgi:hypothetical protein